MAAALHAAPAAHRHDEHDGVHLPEAVCVHLASGRDDLLAHDHEAAAARERAANDDLLGGEQGLVEAAHGLERLAPAEDEAAGGEVESPEGGHGDAHRQMRPRGHVVELDRRPAPDGAVVQRAQRRAQHRLVHACVGVDEEKRIAARGATVASVDASSATTIS